MRPTLTPYPSYQLTLVFSICYQKSDSQFEQHLGYHISYIHTETIIIFHTHVTCYWVSLVAFLHKFGRIHQSTWIAYSTAGHICNMCGSLHLAPCVWHFMHFALQRSKDSGLNICIAL